MFRKKLATILLSLSLMTAYSGIAFAASSYTSTLSMSEYSTVTGATRAYTGPSHKIIIKISSLAHAGDNNCGVTLKKKNLTSTVDYGFAKLNMKTVGSSYSMSSSSCPDGNYYYFFNNRYASGSNGFTSNSVQMSSK